MSESDTMVIVQIQDDTVFFTSKHVTLSSIPRFMHLLTNLFCQIKFRPLFFFQLENFTIVNLSTLAIHLNSLSYEPGIASILISFPSVY